MAITKETLISKAVQEHPAVAQILMEHGLHCVGCHVSQVETIEQGAQSHGMSDLEIEKMVSEVNKAITPKGELQITDAAAEKISKFLKQDNARYLRITVEAGGCSGFMYDFQSTDKKTSEDTLVTNKGAIVIVDKESLTKLQGSIINYIENLHESGFKIENPNFESSCGCGKSFS